MHTGRLEATHISYIDMSHTAEQQLKSFSNQLDHCQNFCDQVKKRERKHVGWKADKSASTFAYVPMNLFLSCENIV